MTDHAPDAVSAFDPTALANLARAVDDDAFPLKFAARYREMLPARVSRIGTALEGHDVDDALDSALSLKVSAITVGTPELADLARLIEGEVRVFDLPAARAAAEFLPAATARADAAIAAYLDA